MPKRIRTLICHRQPVVNNLAQLGDLLKGNVQKGVMMSGMSAPVNTTPPVIVGSPAVGVASSCDPGTWTATPSNGIAFQWEVAGSAIAGAKNQAYTPVASDSGKTLTCVVNAYNARGSVTVRTAGKAVA